MQQDRRPEQVVTYYSRCDNTALSQQSPAETTTHPGQVKGFTRIRMRGHWKYPNFQGISKLPSLGCQERTSKHNGACQDQSATMPPKTFVACLIIGVKWLSNDSIKLLRGSAWWIIFPQLCMGQCSPDYTLLMTDDAFIISSSINQVMVNKHV